MQFFAKCVSSKIFINCGIFAYVPQLLSQHFKYDKAIILVDENVFSAYENKLTDLCNSLNNSYYIKCSAGESAKNFTYVYSLIEQITANKFTKNSLIIALGGGVIGDLAGFIASILNRGLNFIQIPTTLMSQIDSSIGGKNGINLQQVKNKIGTIYFPELIIIDPTFLTTLSKKEITSGLVEAIKHGLISSKSLLKLVLKVPSKIKNNDYDFLDNFIKKAAKVKITIVNKDPYEKLGVRYILNLGHTFGHAIESFCYEKHLAITHGEAVAIGIYLAYKFAQKHSYLQDTKILDQIINIYSKLGINYLLSNLSQENLDTDNIYKYMLADKKNSQNITLILPISNKHFSLITNIDPQKIKNFLKTEI
jgi:3-dehydroquinate synthase